MKKKYKIRIFWKQIILVEIILAISFLIPLPSGLPEFEYYGFPFSVITVNKISNNVVNINWYGFLYNVIFYSAIVFLLYVIWVKIIKKNK